MRHTGPAQTQGHYRRPQADRIRQPTERRIMQLHPHIVIGSHESKAEVTHRDRAFRWGRFCARARCGHACANDEYTG